MVIGIDIDEVLFPLVHPICVFLSRKHGIRLEESQFVTYNFWENPYYKIKGLQATKQQAIDDFLEYTETQDFKEIKPYPGTLEAIRELKKLDSLVAITSRQNQLQEYTFQQLDFYFRREFLGVLFGNDFSKKGGEHLSKRGLCRTNPYGLVWLMIEDNADYARELSQDVHVIVPSRTWNREFTQLQLKNIYPSNSWIETIDIAKKLNRTRR